MKITRSNQRDIMNICCVVHILTFCKQSYHMLLTNSFEDLNYSVDYKSIHKLLVELCRAM